jgi:hypothetical protein
MGPNESFCRKNSEPGGRVEPPSSQTLAGGGGFARAQRDEVRTAFARQVLSIGVEPLWFVGAVAVFVGISVVVQLTFWVGEAGQSLPRDFFWFVRADSSADSPNGSPN